VFEFLNFRQINSTTYQKFIKKHRFLCLFQKLAFSKSNFGAKRYCMSYTQWRSRGAGGSGRHFPGVEILLI